MKKEETKRAGITRTRLYWKGWELRNEEAHQPRLLVIPVVAQEFINYL